MVEHVTSYDNATVGQGNVLNDVLHQYDSLGRLAGEYQNHLALATTGSLSVCYGYENPSPRCGRPRSAIPTAGR